MVKTGCNCSLLSLVQIKMNLHRVAANPEFKDVLERLLVVHYHSHAIRHVPFRRHHPGEEHADGRGLPPSEGLLSGAARTRVPGELASQTTL